METSILLFQDFQMLTSTIIFVILSSSLKVPIVQLQRYSKEELVCRVPILKNVFLLQAGEFVKWQPSSWAINGNLTSVKVTLRGLFTILNLNWFI